MYVRVEQMALEEVQSPCKARPGFEAHRPERGEVAAIVSVDVPVLDHDARAPATSNDVNDLPQGRRASSTVLGDWSIPIGLKPRMQKPVRAVRVDPPGDVHDLSE